MAETMENLRQKLHQLGANNGGGGIDQAVANHIAEQVAAHGPASIGTNEDVKHGNTEAAMQTAVDDTQQQESSDHFQFENEEQQKLHRQQKLLRERVQKQRKDEFDKIRLMKKLGKNGEYGHSLYNRTLGELRSLDELSREEKRSEMFVKGGKMFIVMYAKLVESMQLMLDPNGETVDLNGFAKHVRGTTQQYSGMLEDIFEVYFSGHQSDPLLTLATTLIVNTIVYSMTRSMTRYMGGIGSGISTFSKFAANAASNEENDVETKLNEQHKYDENGVESDSDQSDVGNPFKDN